MKSRTSLWSFLTTTVLAGLLSAGCGDSGHSIGQANGGASGTRGAGGTGGPIGTGGGSGGMAGTAGGPAGAGGGAGNSAGGAAGAAAGAGGHAGRGGVGGTSTGGSNGGNGGGGGQGGQAGAPACSAAPLVACPANEVCDYDTPNRCGAGYEPGHCIVQPQGCTADYNPVCGCDGKTYSNQCARQVARVQLDHTGACSGAGGAGGAGGSGGNNCGANLTCDGSQFYCYQYTATTTGSPPAAICMNLPTSCASNPTCACVCSANTVGCASTSGCTCTENNGLVSLKCSGP